MLQIKTKSEYQIKSGKNTYRFGNKSLSWLLLQHADDLTDEKLKEISEVNKIPIKMVKSTLTRLGLTKK